MNTHLLLGFRTLLVALEGDLLSPGAPHLDQIQRYASLQRRWDEATLAAYLVPIDEPVPVLGR